MINTNKQRVFWTADTHYGHTNIIQYCDRPFKSIQEHDNILISNHNSVVGPNDFVIHLGDFSFGRRTGPGYVKEILQKLNGKIIIIFGNHDRNTRANRDLFFEFHEGICEININREKITCCHYPLLSWNGSYHGRPHVFGHVHSGPRKRFHQQKNSYDVGVDNNNFTPISHEDLMEKLRESQMLPFLRRYE